METELNEIFKLANDENLVKYVAKEIAPKFITAKEWNKYKLAFVLKVAKITVEGKR